MEFKEIVATRYATKVFDGKRIEASRINELFNLIRLAPSSFNIQPWKIKVVEDAKTKEMLSAATYEQAQIKSCSHLLVFCADVNLEQLASRLEQQMINDGYEKEKTDAYIAMLKGVISRLSEDEKKVWTQKQVYLAFANALNGAKSLGFDSCPMEGFNAGEYTRILQLPKNLIPTVLCPVGYASDKPRKKVRFKKEEVFF